MDRAKSVKLISLFIDFIAMGVCLEGCVQTELICRLTKIFSQFKCHVVSFSFLN